MTQFDALLSRMREAAREDQDLLSTFSRVAEDKGRVQWLLGLPELQDLNVAEAFSRKNEARAQELLVSGDVNAALRFAPEGSEVQGRCYASRCQALLQSSKPEQALKDANRALKYTLPDQDAVRLLCLAASCYQQTGASKRAEQSLKDAIQKLRTSALQNNIKAAITAEIVLQLKQIHHKTRQHGQKNHPGSGLVLPELSYGKNPAIPAASSALRLCQSPEKGRYMTATRDLKPGSVLIVDQPYAWALSRGVLTEHCLHCCGYVTEPVPCAKCARVSFCSEECRDASWSMYHRLECSILDNILESSELSSMSWLVYRIVAKAMISENIDFTSLTASDSLEQFLSESYSSVWGQVTHSVSRTSADLLKRTTSAVFLASLLHHVAPGQIDQVTMSAAMLRHLQSCSCNAYQITKQVVPQGDVKRSVEEEIGGAVYSTISLCNHSCNPNVSRQSMGRACIVRAIKHIKKGEEILDNYGPHFLSNPLKERQGSLNNQYFFTCSCEACCNNWPTVDQLNTSVTEYKCVHCSEKIGTSLSGLRSCPNCQKKCDFNKFARRLEVLSQEYNKGLDNLLRNKVSHCLKTFLEYCDLMDAVVVHPNKQFVSCQQAISLSWSLLGNVQNT